MKQEFKLLAAIIRDNTPEDYSYQPEVGEASAKQSDYDMVDVIPVSDPNAATMSQKVVQYQAVFQLSQSAPGIYDLPYLHRQMIETLGVKNAEKIVPMTDELKPLDPVSENMAIITGKPVKAFLYQDHESHIAVHMSAMQDPKLMAMVGQNPQAQAIQAAAAAHLMEHVAFQYRKEIEKQLGTLLPPMQEDDDKPMSPEVEMQVSKLAAMAAARLLQKDQAEAAMQQAQQQQQDPLFQLQQMDMQIKQQEVQRKAIKDQADNVARADEIRIKEEKLRLDTMKTVADMARNADETAARDDMDTARFGLDIEKHKHEVHRAHADRQMQAQQKTKPPKGNK